MFEQERKYNYWRGFLVGSVFTFIITTVPYIIMVNLLIK